MTSIILTRTWITLADDLSQSVTVERDSGGRTTAPIAEVRQYANGRSRVVRRAGSTGSTGLAFRTKNLDVIDTLRGWQGRTVLVRDPRGRGDWRLLLDVTEEDQKGGFIAVTLTLTAVTHSLVV